MSASTTSRDGLSQAMATLTARVAANAADDQAAVALADVLMRQARVSGDGSLPRRAEVVLTNTIAATDSYLGRRMLGAVYLAQHRFLAALEAGRKARQMRPDDSWNYGVIGDAAIELGRYDEAFAAFDRMASLKPAAAAYARIAYARELQGNLDGAVTAMRMAIEATSPQDPEAIAWAWSQLGALHLQKGDIDEARGGLRPGAVRVSAASVRACRRRHESPSRVETSKADWRSTASSSRRRRRRNWRRRSATCSSDGAMRKAHGPRGPRPSAWNSTAGSTSRRSRRRWRDFSQSAA